MGKKRALEENSDGCMNSMERFATILAVPPYDLNKLNFLCITEEAIKLATALRSSFPFRVFVLLWCIYSLFL